MKGKKDNHSIQENQSKLTDFLQKRNIKSNINPVSRLLQAPVQTITKRQSKSHSSHRSQSNRSHTQSVNSSLSASLKFSAIIEKKPQAVKPQTTQQKSNINVLFYLNKIPSRPNGEYIDKLHAEWYTNYERLERDHSFIQWIFPNSFQSRFNMQARPLSAEQAEQFKKNPEILSRYIKSYNMMLSFYGMRIKNKQTGQITRSRNPDFKERYYKTLLTSFHNHMRITRILCSLNEVGFGQYASELCKFLKYEIEHERGQLKLLKKYNVYNQWKAFENYVQSPKNTNVYMLKMAKSQKAHQSSILALENKPKDVLKAEEPPSKPQENK